MQRYNECLTPHLSVDVSVSVVVSSELATEICSKQQRSVNDGSRSSNIVAYVSLCAKCLPCGGTLVQCSCRMMARMKALQPRVNVWHRRSTSGWPANPGWTPNHALAPFVSNGSQYMAGCAAVFRNRSSRLSSCFSTAALAGASLLSSAAACPRDGVQARA